MCGYMGRLRVIFLILGYVAYFDCFFFIHFVIFAYFRLSTVLACSSCFSVF